MQRRTPPATRCPKCKRMSLVIINNNSDSWYTEKRCINCGQTFVPFRLPPKVMDMIEHEHDNAKRAEKRSARKAIENLTLPDGIDIDDLDLDLD